MERCFLRTRIQVSGFKYYVRNLQYQFLRGEWVLYEVWLLKSNSFGQAGLNQVLYSFSQKTSESIQFVNL